MFSNHTAHIYKKQEPNKKVLLGQQCTVGNIPEEITKDPYNECKNWFAARVQVIDGIIKLQSERGPGFKSTSKELGVVCGVHPSTIDRELRALRNLNIVATSYGDISGKTLSINPWFYQPEVRQALLPIFKSLVYLSLFLLVTNPIQSIANNFQPDSKLRSLGVYRYKYINNTIPSTDTMRAIGLITSLNLTQSGRVTLSGFPAAAIEHAERQLTWCTRVRNRFNWFVKVCWQWCNDNFVKPAWHVVCSERTRWGVTKEQPMENDQNASLRSAFSDWDDTHPWKEKLSADIKKVKQDTAPAKMVYKSGSVPKTPSVYGSRVYRRTAEQEEMLARHYAQREQYDREARQLFQYKQEQLRKQNPSGRL
jgi:hypothetical protein